MAAYEFGQPMELLAVERAVAVGVEPVEQRFKTPAPGAIAVRRAGTTVRSIHAAMSLRSRRVGGSTFRSPFRRSTAPGFGRRSARTAAAEPRAERLAHRLPFLVAQPTVAVLIKLFQHLLVTFGIAEAASALAGPGRAGWLGNRWQCHQGRRDKCQC